MSAIYSSLSHMLGTVFVLDQRSELMGCLVKTKPSAKRMLVQL